ncbi:aspartate dehydrogenase [Aliiroseovarius crassostreae]|nr:aspartate dehydrogenase [Aliiroseovarius crassostreae]SFU89842.1 aspartate dehydrogenase [Aliiroseovarius crassostreae]
MNRLGIIGFGAISQSLIEVLREQGQTYSSLALLVLPEKEQETRVKAEALCGKAVQNLVVTGDLETFLETRPELVVECAGHSAVLKYLKPICDAGTNVVLASIGALSDPDLYDLVWDAARNSPAQVQLPAGAIGGIDVLAAARLSGITSVVYTGRKPANAWAGTPAEKKLNLNELTEPTVFFEGSAREAAQEYPKNANVAATLALAGIGMDDTQVRLIADPTTTKNTHEYSVVSGATEYSMRMTGKASALNPKTSMTTVYSLARAVLNQSAAIVI